MDINPDFRTQLEESASGDGAGELKLLRAGSYRMSIQFPGGPYPSKHHALEDYDRWDVAVFTMDGTPATPRTHPQLQHVLWRRYWSDGLRGCETATAVPTEVVQTFYDFLVLGPERYQEMTAMR
jgi:hypothetical protein